MSLSTTTLLFKAAARSETNLRRLQRILKQAPLPSSSKSNGSPLAPNGIRRIVE